jgi:CRP/FNR family transcriptional regulator, anaerobic regulatory protein
MTPTSGLNKLILNDVLNLGHRKTYPQGYVFGDSERHFAPLLFIEKGAIRTYSNQLHGEITHWISVENEFSCTDRFFTGETGEMVMEVLESTDVVEIDRDVLHHNYKIKPTMQEFGRKLAERRLKILEINYQMISEKSAVSRYRFFQSHYPHINGRFMLKYIATWLQIDQATLSRVRGLKKK